jgi:sugar lactone lactonase YvrE
MTLVLALGVAPGARAAAPGASPHSVAGLGRAGVLAAPSGIALDPQGDLFIADTNHCRILVVPAHRARLFGLVRPAHRPSTVAGGSCRGRGGIGFPTGVAVDAHGDVFIAVPTRQRVLELRAGSRQPIPFAGSGNPGPGPSGALATQGSLNQPTGLVVDDAGDLFIADTGDCQVQMVPSADTTRLGQVLQAGHLLTVAGTGVCGSAGRGGPAVRGQLDAPDAVAVDTGGDLFIADRGDDDILEVSARSGTAYGVPTTAGALTVLAGMGGHGPYLADGLSATSVVAELNDPEGVAVNSQGTLFITDGVMHCIRVVPDSTTTVFGRSMQGGDMYTLAGALPVGDATGAGDGTRWVGGHLDVPDGIAVGSSGAVVFSDRGTNHLEEIS